jgi:hypothetical protein
MEYTEQQKQTFKTQFSERRTRQIIVAVPLIGMVVLFALADEASQTVAGLPMAVFLPAFLVVVVGALVFSFRNWRCPACDRYLGKGSNPHFCPKCGVALQ